MSKPGPIPVPATERFMRHVAKDGGCWRWTGGSSFRISNGVACRKEPAGQAARYMWGRMVPLGMAVKFTCGNRWCVNPEHMVPGSRRRETCGWGHPLTGLNLLDGHCRTCLFVLNSVNGTKKWSTSRRRKRALIRYWKARRLDPTPLPLKYRVFTRATPTAEIERATKALRERAK